MRIEKYTENKKKDWDELITNSKNGTFLLKRDFISYHQHRFNEYSILVYKEKDLKGIIPLSIDGNKAISYGGLSYGGLIVGKDTKLQEVIIMWDLILNHLRQKNLSEITLKLIPNHYHDLPADEIEYALFLTNAKIIRVDTAFVIDRLNKLNYQNRRVRSIKKAKKLNPIIQVDDKFDDFWRKILIPNLEAKHNVKPVHSLEEIKFLHSKFPQQIRQANVYIENSLVAGSTLFLTRNTNHAQYISGNELGRKSGALDYLFDQLIQKYHFDKRYFDFGISNEEEGRFLNLGLTDWKESFGARTITHKFYSQQLR